MYIVTFCSKETGRVSLACDGFKKVRENLKGTFALIHDAAQIRYEVYNDRDLVEIGEPFSGPLYLLTGVCERPWKYVYFETSFHQLQTFPSAPLFFVGNDKQWI